MTARWTNARIDATVNAGFVARELDSEHHRAALHRPLAFGDGLTDNTYLDWILEKGRRIFLILDHIGVPGFIFDIIDKTFDDDDLPISEETLYELNLFGGRSETLDKKFFRQQFQFLVHDIRPGGHVDYGDNDVVPVDPLPRRVGTGSALPSGDRVMVSDRVYARRKTSTANGKKGIDREHFVMHMGALQALKHPHLVTVWATYTKGPFSYVLLSPTTDVTLKTFLDEPPKAFKHLVKQKRRELLLKWIHCLTSALAYLHDKGFTHQAIRPSAISIDSNFSIYLGDFGALRALDVEEGGSAYNGELYEYAAPENWLRKPSLHETAPLKTTLPTGGRTTRRLPVETSRSPPASVASPGHPPRARSAGSSSSSTHSKPQKALITTFSPPPLDSPPSCPADVFSLTAVLLQIITLIIGRSQKSFAAHRSRHNRHAGRGGAPADVSYHVNLTQVCTWMDILSREASDRHRKDKKNGRVGIWGAVIWIVEACRGGMKKDPQERIELREMEREVRAWVDKALGPLRRQCCGQEEEEEGKQSNDWEEVEQVTADSPDESWIHSGPTSPTTTTTTRLTSTEDDEDDRTTKGLSVVSTALTDCTCDTALEMHQHDDGNSYGMRARRKADGEALREDMRRFGVLRPHDDWPLRNNSVCE